MSDAGEVVLRLHGMSALSWCGLTPSGRRFLGLAGVRPEVLQDFEKRDAGDLVDGIFAAESEEGESSDDLRQLLWDMAARVQTADETFCVSMTRPRTISMVAGSGTQGVALSIGLNGATILGLDGEELRDAVDRLESAPDEVVVARLLPQPSDELGA